jgi:hypothetical protein
MLFREIIAVYSGNLTKHIYTLCGQNAEISLMLKQVVHTDALCCKGLLCFQWMTGISIKTQRTDCFVGLPARRHFSEGRIRCTITNSIRMECMRLDSLLPVSDDLVSLCLGLIGYRHILNADIVQGLGLNVKMIINGKFWGELMAYFPLIRHGPHKPRRLQQFYCCVYSLPRERVYRAVA